MILGHGIDLVEIKRIESAIARWGNHFLEHLFTEEEIAYAKSHASPAEHFAARFAVKEAVFKALSGTKHVPRRWKDLIVRNDPTGRPLLTFLNRSFEDHVFISITHTKNYAVASAIVQKKG